MQLEYADIPIEDLDMEQDLKKALKEMADAMSTLAKREAQPRTADLSSEVNKRHGVVHYLAGAASIVAVLGAFWGVMRYTISSELAKALLQPNQEISRLQDDVQYLRRDVDELRTQHSSAVFRQGAASSPQEVSKAAAQLKEQKVALPREIVTRVGQTLVKSAAGAGGENWDAAANVLEYVSFLNASLASKISFSPTGLSGTSIYQLPPSWAGTQIFSSRASASPDVPELHPMDAPNLNNKLTSGPAYLQIVGGVLKIDGMVMKRIVVENARIVYDGGPVSLENVIFVNCTFTISHQDKGVMFAEALLSEDAKTDFKAS